MLLVAIRAKNISPIHWLVVVGLTNRVANMVCGVAGCVSGEKYFARTLIGGVGDDGRVANRACGVAGCVSGEKYFAPTLIGGVGADGSGCEQGRCGCWLRFGRKIFRPYIDWWCWG